MLSHCEKTYLPKLYNNCLVTDPHQIKCYPSFKTKSSSGNQLSALAEKFHKNWSEHRESDCREMDDSLTNLNWLHNVSGMMGPQSPSQSPMSLASHQNEHQSLPHIDRGQLSSKATHGDYPHNNAHVTLTHHLDCALKDGGLLDPLVRYDYKNNWSGKPPFSYATLICMAMRELNKTKITLSDIYGWITHNFIYYRLSDSSWQNSVRHNLSLNKCFEKVPRSKDERGKGGFWRINPKYADRLESNLIKYRRQFPVYSMPQPSNGLPAASTLLSREGHGRPQIYPVSDGLVYYDQQGTTDDGWQTTNYLGPNNLQSPPFFRNEGSWISKDKSNYLPNLPMTNHLSLTPARAFNNSTAEQESPSTRRTFCKIPQIYKNQSLLQSLDEFRTSETGQKVDTQVRTDTTPGQSPTMYSLLHQTSLSPSRLSLDDIDSAASSSFDTEMTATSGSCATYRSTSDEHEDALRFSSCFGHEDFLLGPEDYLVCGDQMRHQDGLFGHFI